ncbi:MAG: hypothetical protein ACFFFB_20740 [Candidatus Heimdallarchaeota archaeon]
MKINGNLISIVRIIVEPGESVGGTERLKLKEENENTANKIPGIKINKLILIVNPVLSTNMTFLIPFSDLKILFKILSRLKVAKLILLHQL